jgi:hypothetical protein
MRAAIWTAMMVVVLLAGFGCATEGPTSMDVAPGMYGATFDAARRVIRDNRFDLERVDATEGVISTRPKHSAGLMTLWDGEQSEAGQEIEDLAHNQRRVVRVTFEPAGAQATEPRAGGLAGAETRDLREDVAALTMRVRVIVLRDYMPGWQVQTSSVRLSTHSYDPALGQRGMAPDYETAIDEDRLFAARLTKEIGEAAAKPVVAQGE